MGGMASPSVDPEGNYGVQGGDFHLPQAKYIQFQPFTCFHFLKRKVDIYLLLIPQHHTDTWVFVLTHWGCVTYICINEVTNPLFITMTSHCLNQWWLIADWALSYNENWINMEEFSLKNMNLKMQSANGGHFGSASNYSIVNELEKL